VACLLLIALGLGAAAISWTAPVALLAFGLSGVGMTLAFRQHHLADPGPVAGCAAGPNNGLWFLGFLGARPFSAGLSGLLADEVSVDAAFVTIGLIVVLAGYLCRPSRLSTPRIELGRTDTAD
jgi:hypothetical protein